MSKELVEILEELLANLTHFDCNWNTKFDSIYEELDEELIECEEKTEVEEEIINWAFLKSKIIGYESEFPYK